VADASLVASPAGRSPDVAQSRTSVRRGVRALAAIAAATIAAAFAWLAAEHGTLALWNVIVHESGRYTLGETILYYGHFLREVPVAAAYALFLLGVSGASRTTADGRSAPSSALGWLAAALLLVVAAFVIAGVTHGWHSATLDLLQQRTRDDAAAYGTHWRYHWLSTLWFGATVAAAPWLLQLFGFSHVLQHDRRFTRAAWAYFAVLTLAFGLSGAVFLDPQYAGHQAREILTHSLVTLPLGLAVLLAAAQRPAERASLRLDGWTLVALGFAVVIPVQLAVVALGGGVMEHGQTEHGLAAMVAAHYFEHTLDYLLVLLLLFGGLALQRSRSQ
jgi:hypothetical protein